MKPILRSDRNVSCQSFGSFMHASSFAFRHAKVLPNPCMKFEWMKQARSEPPYWSY